VPDAAPGRPPNGAPAEELAELRELLVGQELSILAEVESRVTDPAKRVNDVAEVLPAAIKSGKAKGLREALEPIVERSFKASVRRNPKELADAIYPIIGPSIRTSIAAALREFAEALNQIVEKSASFRAIRWRIEAIVTGKPFSQILLARSLLYSVEQVFLIHRQSGLLLQHAAAKDAVLKDADMISGMLTAIQDFLTDSFAEGGQELETVDAGRFKLWLTRSPKLLLAGAVSGTAPVELRKAFRSALDGIEETLQPEIANFKQDDLSVFEPAQPFLEKCLLGQSAPDKRKQATLWPYVLVLALIILGIVGYQVRQRSRWNSYIEALKAQPGIVVTSVERQGSSYRIAGLRDPGAANPMTLLRARGLDPGKAKFELEPYLSLNTPYESERALNSARDAVEGRIIRFDPGSSKLASSEADRIDDIMISIRQLVTMRPDAKITITGRADETGTGETNEKLGLDRANRVGDAFKAQGIAESALTIVSVGNRQPLRPGSTDWDRAVNRSVSFKVNLTVPK
jgi:outer membrane protein OmpA-like peptidoglycan-associated protein